MEVRDLYKSYGRVSAVQGLSFDVNRGEVFGLLGPNGAGKSTTLSMLCGLFPPTSGDVLIAGHSVKEDPARVKRLLGVVPQEVALYPRLSGRSNLRFWGEMYGLGGAELSARVDQVLDMVGLRERAGDPVVRYSGGMKRRLNFAVGLLPEAELLILDEPTIGVDPQSRHRMFELIQDEKKRGTTVIYTTHYMEEAETLCDRVAIMDEGRLLAVGTVRELQRQALEHQEIDVTAMGVTCELVTRLQSAPVISRVDVKDDVLKLITDEPEQALATAFRCFTEAGARVSKVEIHRPNLEGLFMKMTGKRLRD